MISHQGLFNVTIGLCLLGWNQPALAEQHPYLGLGMSGAGRNNPAFNAGESDNLSFTLRGSLPLGEFFAVKSSIFIGQYSVQAAPTATLTVPIQPQINGYVGVGYSFAVASTGESNNNNVLGNTAAPVAIGGVEFFPGTSSALYIDVMFTPTGFEGRHEAASLNMGWGMRF